MKSPRSITSAAILLLPVLLSGCEIEDTPPLAFARGHVIDSPVEGLMYSGPRFTEEGGVYRFNPDSNLIFSIGAIQLGDIFIPRTLIEGRLVTPVTLVAGATNENNQEVLNITRFLLTIDFDENSDNGIQIERELHDLAAELELDFTLDSFEFATASQTVLDAFAPVLGGSRTLVDQATASEHLVATLLSSQAGRYTGTYYVDSVDGRETFGQLDVLWDRTGGICGYVIDGSSPPQALTGSFNTSGSASTTVPGIGGTFTLELVNDQLQGFWFSDDAGPGQLEAFRETVPQFFLGPDLLGFVGTYGGSIGPGLEISVLVDSDGNLSLDEPQLCGTILSIEGDRARFSALSVTGDALTGSIEGTQMTGTLENAEGSFDFTLTRQ